VGYLHQSHLLATGSPAELRACGDVVPRGARRLEIRGPQGLRLLDWLRAEPGVREASAFGNSIHALVDRDFPADALTRRGMTVGEIAPSLEDVFVSLTRAQDLPS
jgi:hypothetical protein